jgi:hypothetical protein
MTRIPLSVDFKFCVKHAGQAAGDHTGQSTRGGGQQRGRVMDEQDSGDGGTEGDGSIRRDVGEVKDAEAEINAEGKQGEDKADGSGADEQGHGG